MNISKLWFLPIVLTFTTTCPAHHSKEQDKKLNVLFLSVDDLRPELNCFGQTHIVSPNFDKLAEQGMVFTRAYCNVPVCGASRASVFSGLYPDYGRYVNYDAKIDNDTPGILTLPKYLKQNGYYTVSIGKNMHFPGDAADSWSEQPWRPDYPFANKPDVQVYWRDYQHPDNIWTKNENYPAGAAGPAWESANVDDTVYQDGKIALKAMETLERLASKNQPFFMGLGFIKPHLPFCAPQKYWDLYSEKVIKLADNPFMPEGAPGRAWIDSPELRAYANIPESGVDIADEQALKLRHGYYACVSYIDALIGQVVAKLEKLEIADNTVIMLWGDHGYTLGEHKMWGKIQNFDKAMRATLYVKSPDVKKGKTSSSLVSFVDMYPTICELLELDLPHHLVGKSFSKVLENPNEKVNDYVFCKWISGESIIGENLIYTRYYNRETNDFDTHMLYDHRIDPDENRNVVNDPQYAKNVEKMTRILEKHRVDRKSIE